MKRFVIAIVLLAAAAAAYWFVYPKLRGTPAGSETASADKPASGKGASGGGSGGRGQGGPIAVRTAVAATRDVPVTQAAVGTLQPVETVTIRSQADGVVGERDVEDGQEVKAGDILFKLDDRAIQASIAKDKASLAKDQANLVSSNADLQRTQDLRTKGVATPQQLDQATAAVAVLNASIAMDQAQLQSDEVQLSYFTIKAPVGGRVGVVNTSVGNLVRASDTGGLLTITPMDPLEVSFTVAEREIDAFREALEGGTKVPVQLYATGNTKPVGSGTLSFIDSSVDQASGTVVMKAEIPNADRKLWPGQYVNVVAQIGLDKDAVTVPIAAVQQNDQGPFVYVVQPDKKAVRKAVALGDTAGEAAVIKSGLNAGDHVVIDGQLRLTDGVQVRETVVPDSASSGSPPPAKGAQQTSAADQTQLVQEAQK